MVMSRMHGNQKQWQSDIQSALCIIPDKLYFTMTKCARNTDSIHMFSIDHALRYEPFFVDFGPLNLACLYKFCKLIEHKLKDNKHKNHKIYYYCDRTPQRISNAAYLMGAYQIIELGRTPAEAYKRVKPLASKGVPFRDASMGLCTYPCKPKHCITALYSALKLGFINFNIFNVDEYEHYERVECGDLNILIPNKFIAFAGPYFKEFDEEGYPALTPDFYIPIWRKFRVTTVIRLNKKCYDKRIFTKAGFDHYDLYFIDGTTPNDNILNKFIDICEKAKGVLAVHCKAGLGRTGSCIGCYIMKHYGWTASQTIAWLRICRPGSVIGPQQHFLEEQQAKMWKLGDIYRKKYNKILKYDPRIKVPVTTTTATPNDDNDQTDQKDNDKLLRKQYVKRFIKSKNNLNNNNNNNVPLPTDPGQNQGATLKHAKAQHQHPQVDDNINSSNQTSSNNPYSQYNLNNINANNNKWIIKDNNNNNNNNNGDVKMKSVSNSNSNSNSNVNVPNHTINNVVSNSNK